MTEGENVNIWGSSLVRFSSICLIVAINIFFFQNCSQKFQTSDFTNATNLNATETFNSLNYGPPNSDSGTGEKIHFWLKSTTNNCNVSSTCRIANDQEIQNILEACAQLSAVANRLNCQLLPTSSASLENLNIINIHPCDSLSQISGASFGFEDTTGQSNSGATIKFKSAYIRSCYTNTETRRRESLILLMRIAGVSDNYRKSSFLSFVDTIPGRSSLVDKRFDFGNTASLNTIGNLYTSLYSSSAVSSAGSQIAYTIKQSMVEDGARHLSRSFADGTSARRLHPSRTDAIQLQALYPGSNAQGKACAAAGIEIPHGTSEGFYFSRSPANGEGCRHEFRICNDGILSGSAMETHCDLKCRIGENKDILLGSQKTLYRDGKCSQPVSFDCNLTEIEKVNGTFYETCTNTTTPNPPPTSTMDCPSTSTTLNCGSSVVCTNGIKVDNKVNDVIAKIPAATHGSYSYITKTDLGSVTNVRYKCVDGKFQWDPSGTTSCSAPDVVLPPSDSRCKNSCTAGFYTNLNCEYHDYCGSTFIDSQTISALGFLNIRGKAGEVVDVRKEDVSFPGLAPEDVFATWKTPYTATCDTNGSGKWTPSPLKQSYCLIKKLLPGNHYKCRNLETPTVSPKVLGYIDRVNLIQGGGSKVSINGWACVAGEQTSIPVHLYINGPAGSGGEFLSGALANQASEKAVADACSTGGTEYRYSIVLDESQVNKFKGKKIFIHGISGRDSVPNNLLVNSGSFLIP